MLKRTLGAYNRRLNVMLVAAIVLLLFLLVMPVKAGQIRMLDCNEVECPQPWLEMDGAFDDATWVLLRSMEGKTVVMEADADGETTVVKESTLDRKPRGVGERGWHAQNERVLGIADNTSHGACDDDEACEAALNEACENAGYAGGLKKDVKKKPKVNRFPDGTAICAGGECEGTSDRGTTGGVPFVHCSAPNKQNVP